ncbi:MAG: epoxyqueuosine reductase [Proteobacteria bacterium]|nr:epoxyqueuosine reductase [Pseudomonadota bacterium]
MSLNQEISEFLRSKGALRVGFATRETLAGGPPSTELEYILPGARSAISFALPLKQEYIEPFLAKKDRSRHEEDNLSLNLRIKDLSWEVAGLLKSRGIISKGTAANLKYRQDTPNWQVNLLPDISHRYLAVRSGVASFGWSGNAGIKGPGPAILLGTTVTTAELEPTDPIPESENFCNKCKLCTSACPMEMIEKKKEMSVTIGGVTFTHAARKSYLLCQFCCGGFTGLHKSGRWSSWSPGRFRIPDEEPELLNEFLRAVSLYNDRPPLPGGYTHPAHPENRIYLTCGNCQMICTGEKKTTGARLKLLHTSGCVIQNQDGSLSVHPALEAETAFEKFDPKHRDLYR